MSRPRHWPDGQSANTPSSASSFGFDVAAELSRMNHPTAFENLRRWKAEATSVLEAWEAVWEAAGKPGHLGQSKADAVRDLFTSPSPPRADLLSRVLPTAEEVEVGTSSPRRGPVPMPSSAVGLGVERDSRRRVTLHWYALAVLVGWLLRGRQ